MSVVAVLTAAGSGTRLGSPRPKALVELGGEPLVLVAARTLLAVPELSALVVTAPAAHVTELREVLEPLVRGAGRDVPLAVVAGGPSRQASVAAGLDALGAGLDPDTVVLVHDAARPLVPLAAVMRVVTAVEAGYRAVVPVVAVADTIKTVDPDAEPPDEADPPTPGAEQVVVHRVTDTPPRSTLRAVQTPQGFRLGLLREAHAAGAARAEDEAVAASDDAGLVEAIGVPVHVVEGDPRALKVTTSWDLRVAELIQGPS